MGTLDGSDEHDEDDDPHQSVIRWRHQIPPCPQNRIQYRRHMTTPPNTPVLTTEEIEVRAKALYDRCPSVKPTWEQLGDVTRSVWRERVQPDGQPAASTVPERQQGSLF